MRRNSIVPPPKIKQPEQGQRHVLSEVLKNDTRAQGAPRVVETLHSLEDEGGEARVFLVKIYGGLETPGTELMTVSCVSAASGVEAELRFDERFPVSIRFRNQTDAERVSYARELIGRAGGYENLLGTFRSAFPRITI